LNETMRRGQLACCFLFISFLTLLFPSFSFFSFVLLLLHFLRPLSLSSLSLLSLSPLSLQDLVTASQALDKPEDVRFVIRESKARINNSFARTSHVTRLSKRFTIVHVNPDLTEVCCTIVPGKFPICSGVLLANVGPFIRCI